MEAGRQGGSHCWRPGSTHGHWTGVEEGDRSSDDMGRIWFLLKVQPPSSGLPLPGLNIGRMADSLFFGSGTEPWGQESLG